MAERDFSQRRACELVGVDPKAVRWESEAGDAGSATDGWASCSNAKGCA